MLVRADAMAGEMAYEDDVERRLEMSVHISRDITDTFVKVKNMTRWLKAYEEKMITPPNEDGTFKILSYDQVVQMYKTLCEEYRLLEKQVRKDEEEDADDMGPDMG